MLALVRDWTEKASSNTLGSDVDPGEVLMQQADKLAL
jgi:hypothetical protein